MSSADLASLISETEASIQRSGAGSGSGSGSGSGAAAEAAAAAASRASAARHAAQVDAQLAHSRLQLAAAQASMRMSPQTGSTGAAGGGSGMQASSLPLPPASSSSSSITSTATRRFEEHKSSYTLSSPIRGHASSLASSYASRALSPPPGAGARREVTPSAFSPSRLFARPGQSNAGSAVPPSSSPPAAGSPRFKPLPQPYTSPLSPREQARMEIARHSEGGGGGEGSGVGAMSSTAHGMRSPRLTSPLRSSFHPSGGSTLGAGVGMSSSFSSHAHRSRSASPGRFAAAAAATRSNATAANLDTTLRFENLEQSPQRSSPTPASSYRHGAGSPLRQASASVRVSSASPTRSHFSPSRSAALEAAAQRSAAAALAAASTTLSSSNGVFVHAQLEPWRELNRQLALNGLPLVHPFPVPVSVSAADPLLWSPRSSKSFSSLSRQSVNATPSASLTLLLTTCSNLLTEYARRGRTIEDLMRKNAESSNSHAHCHGEIAALRRAHQSQGFQLDDLHKALEHAAVERASAIKAVSAQLDQSALNYSNLEAKYAQAQVSIRQKEDQLAELRLKLEEIHGRAERQAAYENERHARTQRETEASHAATVHAASQARRELERELQECQMALLAVQVSKKEGEDEARRREEESSKRESHAAYIHNLKVLELEERLRATQLASEHDLVRERSQADSRLADTRLQHEHELAGLRARSADVEAELTSKLRSVEEALSLATGQVGELTRLNGLLRSDLASANHQTGLLEEQVATQRRKYSQQLEAYGKLEGRFDALQAQAVQGYNLQELTRFLSHAHSSRLLSREEQLASQFDATRLSHLPREVLQDLLASVCHKLKQSDASLVGATLDDLVRVASAVPGMQDFIAQVWGVVHAGEEGEEEAQREDLSQMSSTQLLSLTTSVIPTLRAWSHAASMHQPLQAFRAEVLDVLRRRQHRSPLNPLHSGQGSHVKIHDGLGNEEILLELNDIVSNENRLNALVYDQTTPSGFFQLWAQMDKAPLLSDAHYSGDSERILAHLGQLFDVPHRVGLFPKINELFLFVQETRPALAAMRSLLKLESKATIQTCVKALKRVMEQQAEHGSGGGLNFTGGMDGPSLAASHGSSYRTSHSPARAERSMRGGGIGVGGGVGTAWTVSSPSRHEASFLTTTALASSSSAPTQSQMQRNAQYYTVCKALKSMLHVGKISDIVPAVQKLHAASTQEPKQQQQPQQQDYLSASILAQLKPMLDVDSVTDIPSAVTWLRGEYDNLKRKVAEQQERSAEQQRAAAQKRRADQRAAEQKDDLLVHAKRIVGVQGEDDAALIPALQKLVRAATQPQPPASQPASTSSSSSSLSREDSLILMQLKGYLDVKNVSDIVPTVRTLINKVHSYGQSATRLAGRWAGLGRMPSLAHMRVCGSMYVFLSCR